MLWLEDLHWSDTATVDLLADLGDAVAFLEKNPPAQPKAQAPTFAH